MQKEYRLRAKNNKYGPNGLAAPPLLYGSEHRIYIGAQIIAEMDFYLIS
jgi:hypothetical protein